MSESNIRSALIQGYVSGAFGLPTAYENKSYTPDNNPYAQLTLIPASETASSLGAGGKQRVLGIFQITLRYPENDGVGDILDKADAIKNYFYQNNTLTYNSQTVSIGNISRSTGSVDGDYYKIDLSVNYRAEITRG